MTSSQLAGLSVDAVSYGIGGYHAFGRALVGAKLAPSVFGKEGSNNGRTDDLSTMHVPDWTRSGQNIIAGPDASASSAFRVVVGYASGRVRLRRRLSVASTGHM